MTLKALCAALLLTASLGACATAPKPCTTEWIDYRTEKVLRNFAIANRGLVSDLRNLKRADGDIDPVQALLLASKADDLRKFARNFERIVLPELQSAYDQCGKDAEFVPAFTEFLRREGVSDEALEWVGPILALSLVIDSQN
jgi:hypothetical protein